MCHRSLIRSSIVLVLVALALVGVTACKRATPTTTPTEPDIRDTSDRQIPPAPDRGDTRTDVVDKWDREAPSVGDASTPAEELAEMARRNLRTVYFAFDSYDLTPSTLATLRDNAEWLKAYPQVGIVIEGHCDERGTIEYNLSLGEKRANSIRDYLVSLGVNRSRMRVVTYGEERPADPGHDEAAWSRNRRAEFQPD